MGLMDEIKHYIKDEEDANATYSRMANDADNAGMHDTARILRGIAADELRHKEMLEGMYYRPEFGPTTTIRETVLPGLERLREIHTELPRGGSITGISGFMPTESPRPFPKTYGDWVNLAEDIKVKTTLYNQSVNSKLGIIGGLEEGDVDDAKRWLVGKARELSIT